MAITTIQTKNHRTENASHDVIAAGLASEKTKLPTQNEIRERAYQIHKERKGEHRNPALDWLQAERELCSKDLL
jgi:hypothetical protein